MRAMSQQLQPCNLVVWENKTQNLKQIKGHKSLSQIAIWIGCIDFTWPVKKNENSGFHSLLKKYLWDSVQKGFQTFHSIPFAAFEALKYFAMH